MPNSNIRRVGFATIYPIDPSTSRAVQAAQPRPCPPVRFSRFYWDTRPSSEEDDSSGEENNDSDIAIRAESPIEISRSPIKKPQSPIEEHKSPQTCEQSQTCNLLNPKRSKAFDWPNFYFYNTTHTSDHQDNSDSFTRIKAEPDTDSSLRIKTEPSSSISIEMEPNTSNPATPKRAARRFAPTRTEVIELSDDDDEQSVSHAVGKLAKNPREETQENDVWLASLSQKPFDWNAFVASRQDTTNTMSTTGTCASALPRSQDTQSLLGGMRHTQSEIEKKERKREQTVIDLTSDDDEPQIAATAPVKRAMGVGLYGSPYQTPTKSGHSGSYNPRSRQRGRPGHPSPYFSLPTAPLHLPLSRPVNLQGDASYGRSHSPVIGRSSASSNATFQSVQPLRFARDVFDDSCNGTGSGEDVPQQRIQVLRQGDELVPAQKLPKKRAFVNGDSQEAIGDGGADFDQPDAVQSQIPMAQNSMKRPKTGSRGSNAFNEEGMYHQTTQSKPHVSPYAEKFAYFRDGAERTNSNRAAKKTPLHNPIAFEDSPEPLDNSEDVIGVPQSYLNCFKLKNQSQQRTIKGPSARGEAGSSLDPQIHDETSRSQQPRSGSQLSLIDHTYCAPKTKPSAPNRLAGTDSKRKASAAKHQAFAAANKGHNHMAEKRGVTFGTFGEAINHSHRQFERDPFEPRSRKSVFLQALEKRGGLKRKQKEAVTKSDRMRKALCEIYRAMAQNQDKETNIGEIHNAMLTDNTDDLRRRLERPQDPNIPIDNKCFLLESPLEVREIIYRELLRANEPIKVLHGWSQVLSRQRTDLHSTILSTCQDIHREAGHILYAENVFRYKLRDDGMMVEFELGKKRSHNRTMHLRQHIHQFRHLELYLEGNRTGLDYGYTTNAVMELLIKLGATGLHTFTLSVSPRMGPKNTVTMAEYFKPAYGITGALKQIEAKFVHVNVFLAATEEQPAKSLRIVIDKRPEISEPEIFNAMDAQDDFTKNNLSLDDRRKRAEQDLSDLAVHASCKQLNLLPSHIEAACKRGAAWVVKRGWFQEFEPDEKQRQMMNVDIVNYDHAAEEGASNEDLEGVNNIPAVEEDASDEDFEG